jgi:hypothetical protein
VNPAIHAILVPPFDMQGAARTPAVFRTQVQRIAQFVEELLRVDRIPHSSRPARKESGGQFV